MTGTDNFPSTICAPLRLRLPFASHSYCSIIHVKNGVIVIWVTLRDGYTAGLCKTPVLLLTFWWQ